MSEAALRLGKLDMVSPRRGGAAGRQRRASSPLGQSAPREGFDAMGGFQSGGVGSASGSFSGGDSILYFSTLLLLFIYFCLQYSKSSGGSGGPFLLLSVFAHSSSSRPCCKSVPTASGCTV